MIENKKDRINKFLSDFIFIAVGCCIAAFGTISILIANGLSTGGITGIARILQQETGMSFSLLYYGLVIIVFLSCIFVLGWREARKILLLSIVFPTALFLFETIDIELLEQPDTILAVIYCGVFLGVGNGLVFSRGYSFGGSDTIAKMIKVKLMPQVSLSKVLLIVDGVIIVASGIFFGRNIALYALVTQVIFSRVVEYVMYGFEMKIVQLEIITDKHDEIAWYIMNTIGRGVSNVKIVGEYTQKAKDKIVTLCSPRESMLIKNFISKTDPSAFVSVLRVQSVWGTGQGFSDLREEKSGE